MKIEWICEEEREVPKVGLMITGLIRDVDREIGEALIKQGLAKEKKVHRSPESVHRNGQRTTVNREQGGDE